MMEESKVLFVDDEPSVLESMRHLFIDDNNIEVVLANGHKEAMSALEAGRVDVLVSDFAMPEMNGIELMKLVRERYPYVRRMLLSGAVTLEHVIESFNVGLISRFFVKPWRDEELRAAVQVAIREGRGIEASLRLWEEYQTLKVVFDQFGKRVLGTCVALRDDSRFAQDGQLFRKYLHQEMNND